MKRLEPIAGTEIHQAMRYAGCSGNVPLNACQYGSHVVGWTPSVLQDVQAEFSGSIDIGMEHLADKFDTRRFIRILFLEMHH